MFLKVMVEKGVVNTVLGTFPCPKKFNKNKVKIVIRNEAIKLFSVNKSLSKTIKIIIILYLQILGM